jgi:hypothetical protein
MWPKKKDKRTKFGKSDPGSTQSAKTIYHRGKVNKPNRLIHKAKCKQDTIRGYPIGSCMNLNPFGTVCKFESVVGLLIITGSRCNCAYQLQANPITLTVVTMMQRYKWGKSWNHYFQSHHLVAKSWNNLRPFCTCESLIKRLQLWLPDVKIIKTGNQISFKRLMVYRDASMAT